MPWSGSTTSLCIFRDSRYWATVLRSAFYAVCSTGISMGMALTLALFVDRSLKGTGLFQSIYIWPYAIAAPAAGVAFRFIFSPEAGLVGIDQRDLARHLGSRRSTAGRRWPW